MTEKKRRRRFGDRYEGRRLRTLSPMTYVAPYIMVDRNGASNLIKDTVVLTDLEDYIAKKRREGLAGFGMMYIFIAAYIRAVAKFPGINRFLSGQKIYARNNVQIVIDIKKQMKLNAQNTTIKLDFQPDATVYDVYEKFTAAFEENRVDTDVSAFDSAAKFLAYIPGVFLKFIVWFLKLLDYFGLVPKFLINLSPFHGSMFITSMGSLGIPPVYHHLYDFGNIPIFFSFGTKRTEVYLTRDGVVDERKVMDFSVVTDERICDGHYFAAALKCIRDSIKHPETLDEPPEEVVEDVE
ncbi:MAG: hypothetical protein E7582_01795 [Ruminococcaceae bacterium]|nr:hypothetical protein [Oscillospiraceae bacterium]